MRVLYIISLFSLAAAETGREGWLRYAPFSSSSLHRFNIPSKIVALNASITSPVHIAGEELKNGINSIFDQKCTVHHGHEHQTSSIIVGTVDQYTHMYGQSIPGASALDVDGFYLNTRARPIQIIGQNERGALYGAFEYLSMLAQGNFSEVDYATNPHAPIRWTNEWDDMDSRIERGYGGPSIFFANGTVVDDLTRAAEYARLLASIRVNAVVVNNVNANATTLSAANIEGLGRIADVFRPYGVQLGLSLNFASPAGAVPGRPNLTTFDPLDEDVVTWWTNVTEDIYRRIPDMGGYLVKASSEGQPGPETYNRTLAEGANLFAWTIAPYNGIVMFRAFVYDQLNESNWKDDRANAAVDYFKPLDGDFDENVVLQIKYGPIDFQVREPPSPLFANLRNTTMAIELQVTQEYLGQQSHLMYLAPLWRTILDFDMRVDDSSSYVSDIYSGKHFGRRLGGSAAVVNVGTNDTWLGSHLSMSNLYAYGRLAWNPAQDSEEILQDWIRLTFSHDHEVVDTITQMSMESWPAYENYTGNLGIQTLTDILYTHYGPNPQSQDNNGWGQWTRADHDSVGMDRTVANGTGNSGQYPRAVYEMYEHIDTTPDDLLLWFHHVPWTHVLKSGKTVIQHFYDAHYAGSETAQTFQTMWQSLRGKIDEQRYEETLFKLIYQAGHSIVWRDAIVNFYHNMTGIADEYDRVGRHPWRVEAEDMQLDGYQPYSVSPFECASNATAVVTSTNTTIGTATATLGFPSGIYDLAINYFDIYGGQAHWRVYINEGKVAEWIGNAEDTLSHTPSIYIDGHSAVRKTVKSVKINTGDVFKIVGTPDGVEPAPLDYVAFLPEGVVD